MTVTNKAYTSQTHSSSGAQASWSLKFNFSDIEVTGSTFNFVTPTISGTYSIASSSYAQRYAMAILHTPCDGWPYYDSQYSDGQGNVYSRLDASIDGISIAPEYNGWHWEEPGQSYDMEYYNLTLWSADKVITKRDTTYAEDSSYNRKTSYHNITLDTNRFFTSSNKTKRTLDVVFNFVSIWLRTQSWEDEESDGPYYSAEYKYGYSYDTHRYSPPLSYTLGTVTLNVPPVITLGTPTYTLPYAGVGSYNVPITSAEAFYGGDISKITLTIGSESVTKTYSSSTVSNDSISIIPTIAGTNITPTITIEDSRGQTYQQSLSPITINSYANPSISFDVYRTDNNGKKNDEGTYGLIIATVTFLDSVSTITQPAVTINGTITNNITWYSSYNPSSSSSCVSNQITNWSIIRSGDTIYGLMSGPFSTAQSYIIGITAEDSSGASSNNITQTLSTAFYTIDFQAGGKEIAFGGPANDTLTQNQENVGLFKCNMETEFNDMTSEELDSFLLSLTQSQVDFVVEQDTDGIWTYRKWNSGIAECWGKVSTSTSFAVWTSPIYYGSTYSANQTYPTGLFIEEPRLNVSIYMSGTDVWLGFGSSGGAPSATKTGQYYPLRVGAGNAGTFTIQFYAIGKWK